MVRKLDKKGFSTVEGLLSLIVVVLIAFVGYYIWHTNRQASDTLNNASSAATQTASGHSTAKMTGAEATVFVQNTYNDYLKVVKQTLAKNAQASGKTTQPVEVPGLAAVKKDLGTDFYKQIAPAKASEDKVGCALYAVDSYKARLLNVNQDGTATVAVDINAGGSVNGTITVTVDLSSRKITQITCPA